MQRPARATAAITKAIDEGTDTYDTIDWLLKNVPRNNGRVGMLGVSYDGWTTIMAALEPHPALKAISPQASPADMWLGDDFHHNGAFRLSYGFEYAAMMETGKDVQQFAFDRYDTYEWYLALGPLANVNARTCTGQIPTWNDFVAHPDYDAFWKRQTMMPYHPRRRRCRRSTSPAGGTRRTSTARSRSTRRSRSTTREAPELPGRRALEPRRLVARRRARSWARSTSAARPRSTSASRSRRRGSPTSEGQGHARRCRRR